MNPKLALIDMDGTVYSGNTAIEDSDKGLNFLREKGIETLFLTNYAGQKRKAYSDKLEKMGFEASSKDVVTSGWLTAEYIAENFPGSKVFVLGEKGLKEELRDKNIDVAESCEDSDILVASNKSDLSYRDLKEVLQGLGDSTKLFGTNPDETIPGEEGQIPGAGTIINAVETMTGKEAEIIGKPSKNAVETVTEIKGVSPGNCLMIGDRLNTDILMGNKNGMETVLVLSGVTDREEVKTSNIEPDHVIDSLADIDEIF